MSFLSLRTALNANALFSIFTGLPLAFATSVSAQSLRFESEILLKFLGLGLLCHAIILFWAQRRSDLLKWARLNLILIAPYPFFILILILMGKISGKLGVTFALGDAMVVGLIAIWQYSKLKPL